MKKISFLILSLVVTTFLFVPDIDGKLPVITEDSRPLEYTLEKGVNHEYTLIFENIRNTSMKGTLEAMNVECAYKCPSIVLISDPEMYLTPGGSMRIKFSLNSNILNDLGETDLSIDLIDEEGDQTRLIEIIVHIEHNVPLYGICCFIGLVSVFVVGSIVYFIRSVKRSKNLP